MNIYTKGGDKGTTSLVHTKNVSKSDDRIQLVGTIDELTSHLGLVKTMLKDEDTIQFLEKIQRTLITVMAGVADPYKRDYRIDDVKTEYLEDEINRMEGLFQRPKEFILPGSQSPKRPLPMLSGIQLIVLLLRIRSSLTAVILINQDSRA